MTLTVDEAAAGFRYDPYSIAVMTDPMPYYRELRENHPFYYLPQYDTYVLTRFEDVTEFLGTAGNVFISSDGTLPQRDVLRRVHTGTAEVVSTTPLESPTQQGSPIYENLRHAVLKPYRPGSIARMAERIHQIVRERLDVLLPRGHFDLTQHYGGITAASVTCDLFRLPLSEAKYVLDTVNAGSLTDPTTGSTKSAAERKLGRGPLHELVRGAVRRRRAEGPDGSWELGDHLFDLEIDGHLLDDDEIARVLGSPLVGGTETVPKVVAHGLWELSKRPDQWAAVAADPEHNAKVAFREMVRLCAPAQWFLRTVHKPTRLGPLDLEVGQRVMYIMPAAARDPREYGPDAEEFRWDRPNERLLNFGHGQHFCLGYHLAMLEGAILVEEFVKRVRSFVVEEDEAVRRPSFFQWGWNELPVTILETIH